MAAILFHKKDQGLSETVFKCGNVLNRCVIVQCPNVADAQNETALNKAILLGSAFLIDFMYFEVKNNN